MPNYNRVMLMGHLTRDPEMKVLESGTTVTNVSIAVNRSYTNKNTGESVEDVCFVDLEAWNRTAETLAEFFTKGRPIHIEGRLRQQRWQNEEGENRSKLVVVIDAWQFVDKRDEEDSETATATTTETTTQVTDDDDDIPF